MLKDKNYDNIDNDAEYKYLRMMSIDSVEEENLQKLLKERNNKTQELDILKNKTIEQIWKEELKELSAKYSIYRNDRIRRASGVVKKKTKLIKIKKKKK